MSGTAIECLSIPIYISGTAIDCLSIPIYISGTAIECLSIPIVLHKESDGEDREGNQAGERL